MKIKHLLILLISICILTNASTFSQLVNPVVSISGTVFNAITKEPLTVYVVAYDQEGKRANAARSNSSENGYYFLTGLKPGQRYQIVVEQAGFFRESYEIDIPKNIKYTEYSRDFALIPIKSGTLIPLPVPPFEFNKTKLRVGAEEYLENFAKHLAKNKDLKIEIISYPDATANPNDNLKLTEERAKSLVSYFVMQGVEPERLTIKGNANPDPKNPPPTEKRAKGKRYIGPIYFRIL